MIQANEVTVNGGCFTIVGGDYHYVHKEEHAHTNDKVHKDVGEPAKRLKYVNGQLYPLVDPHILILFYTIEVVIFSWFVISISCYLR